MAGQPIAFEIVEQDGIKVATNGTVRMTVLDGGALKRRRGVTGLATKPAAETLLPHLNKLAGELLQTPDMPAEEAVGRVLALAGLVPVSDPKRIEWAVAELNGVKVYTDGAHVVVTTQELMP